MQNIRKYETKELRQLNTYKIKTKKLLIYKSHNMHNRICSIKPREA